MGSWKLLFFVIMFYLIQTAYTTGITQNGNAVSGASSVIDCVTDSLTSAVQIGDPSGVIAATCLIPSGSTSICFPGTDPNYIPSQDVATKTTSVTITATSRASHEGTWTCTKVGDTPFATYVTVLTVPAGITESASTSDFEVTTTTSETLTVEVQCANPTVQIDWEFVTDASASTGISATRKSCTYMGPTGGSCADAAANTSSCDFDVTPTSTTGLPAGRYKLKANLYLNGQVTSTGISLDLSTIFTIPEKLTTTTQREIYI